MKKIIDFELSEEICNLLEPIVDLKTKYAKSLVKVLQGMPSKYHAILVREAEDVGLEVALELSKHNAKIRLKETQEQP